MKQALIVAMSALSLSVLSTGLQADESSKFGGDVYSKGATAKIETTAPRDSFAAGFSVSITGSTVQDAHAAGFDVDIEGKTGEDLYVAGGSVKVAAPVQQDVTVSGFNVRLTEQAAVGGNARIAAGALEVSGPISGNLLAVAGKLTLNSVVAGDAQLTAGDINFGEGAVINGTLTYSAPSEIDIPESVIAATKVKFVELDKSGWTGDLRKAVEDSAPNILPTFAKTAFAFLVIFGFFIAVAAACLSFFPDRVDRLKELAQSRPGTSFILGYLGLATLVGMVPISAMTIIGLPLIPVVFLMILVFWLLGYLLGSYAVGMRVWQAFGQNPDTVLFQLLVLGSALIVLAILNFIPVVGWLINLAVVFIGLGSIVMSTFNRFFDASTNNTVSKAKKGSRK